MATNYIRVGRILEKKSPKTGTYADMGDMFKKNTVTLTVKNAEGKVLAQVDNPKLMIQNPRNIPGKSKESTSNIPSFVLEELTLVVDN